jgi:hypothetical protein
VFELFWQNLELKTGFVVIKDNIAGRVFREKEWNITKGKTYLMTSVITSTIQQKNLMGGALEK